MSKGIYKQKGSQNWWIRYAGLDGKMKFQSTETTSKREAEYILNCRKKDVKEGKRPLIKKIANHSFRELAEEYLPWAERQRSFRIKQCLIKKAVEQFGNYPLRSFSTKLLEQYQSEGLSEGKKPATINLRLALLSHMFSKAVEWELIEMDILEKIRRVKRLPENNKRLRFLSLEESQELINHCNPLLKPIVITALNTGMRLREVLDLAWDRVDLKHGFILLEMTKNGSRREIPINQTLRNALTPLIRRLDSFLVFPTKKGSALTSIHQAFQSACRRAGIKDFRFHDLRHTFASQLIMKGADLVTLKDLLGHKSLNMTLRYSHLSPDHKKQAVCLLDEINTEADKKQNYIVWKK